MAEPECELTPEVLATFRDKISKDPEIVRYFQENDYLTAYARNTDSRVKDDPKWAIGRGDEWDSHGLLQRDFLISLGMKPEHTLLDVGCGVGRASRRFVPYLNNGNYTGIDISPAALAHAIELSVTEGWKARKPTFLLNSDMDLGRQFDFIWAHSVFTHLPASQIKKMIGNAARIMGALFAFTYKAAPEPRRSGLKQFQFNFGFFENIALSVGMKAEDHPERWPAGQRTIVLTRM